MRLTAQQLKEKDPKQFEKEYYEWCRHEPYGDWWECEWDRFVEDMDGSPLKPTGKLQFDLYHRTISFDGSVNLAQFMEGIGMHEQCYPLWQAIKDDGSRLMVRPTHRGNFEFELYESTYDSLPTGVFADMSEEDWADMLQEMWQAHDPEGAAREFVETAAHDLLCRLEEEYEHRTSEESFIESCECNDVTFDYEGDDDEIHD